MRRWFFQRNRRYRVVFRFAGQKLSRTLKTAKPVDAEAPFARLKDNPRRAEPLIQQRDELAAAGGFGGAEGAVRIGGLSGRL